MVEIRTYNPYVRMPYFDPILSIIGPNYSGKSTTATMIHYHYPNSYIVEPTNLIVNSMLLDGSEERNKINKYLRAPFTPPYEYNHEFIHRGFKGELITREQKLYAQAYVKLVAGMFKDSSCEEKVGIIAGTPMNTEVLRVWQNIAPEILDRMIFVSLIYTDSQEEVTTELLRRAQQGSRNRPDDAKALERINRWTVDGANLLEALSHLTNPILEVHTSVRTPNSEVMPYIIKGLDPFINYKYM